MRSERVNRRVALRTTAIWTVACLLTGFALAQSEPSPTSPEPVEADTGAQTSEAPPRADEPPIDIAAPAGSPLEYEPSESISEDSSVSFPVDI